MPAADTPILTFINKLDREVRDPIEVMDEVESVLSIQCAPITWPIGMANRFKGIYHLYDDEIHMNRVRETSRRKQRSSRVSSQDAAKAFLGDQHEELVDEIELVRGASHEFDLKPILPAS